MIKSDKGITLISLIVTVMLLIILVGIGLDMAFISIKNVTDNKLNTELGLVRQVVIEKYSMALAINKTESSEVSSFWIGEKIVDVSTIKLPENADVFLQRLQNAKPQYQIGRAHV